MDRIRIRDGRPADAAKLTALAMRSKAHWGYSREFMEACREELSVPRAAFEQETVRIAVDGRGIAGFYRLANGGAGYEIEGFFIDPRRIRSGIGRKLWDDLVARACQAGIRMLTCQSDPQAEAFYLAMGMRRIGERPSTSISGRSLPLLRLELPPRG